MHVAITFSPIYEQIELAKKQMPIETRARQIFLKCCFHIYIHPHVPRTTYVVQEHYSTTTKFIQLS